MHLNTEQLISLTCPPGVGGDQNSAKKRMNSEFLNRAFVTLTKQAMIAARSNDSFLKHQI